MRVPNVARSLALISCLPYCHVPQNYFAMCHKIAELQSAKLLPRPSLVGPHVSKNCCCNNQRTVQKTLRMYCLCIVFDNAQCNSSCLVWTHYFVWQSTLHSVESPLNPDRSLFCSKIGLTTDLACIVLMQNSSLQCNLLWQQNHAPRR